MANKIPCEIIQDLLPSYLDGLTSEVTNRAVKEHVLDCTNCKQCMQDMKIPLESTAMEEEKQEIDFLKKAKRNNRRILGISCLAAAIVVICLVVFARVYLIGSNLDADAVTCRVEVEDYEETGADMLAGNTKQIFEISGVVVEEGTDISDVMFTEEHGVLTISFKGALASPFHDNKYEERYVAQNEVTQVYVGDQIVWDNGRPISANVAAVYATKHPYVGNMPANNETANALGMKQTFGDYTNELQTSTEPYGWIFHLKNDISEETHFALQYKMEAYAFVLIAMVDNLNYVTYNYTVDGIDTSYTIDYDTAQAGRDLKTVVGSSPAELERLMERMGLCDYPQVSEWIGSNTIQIGITNTSEDEIYGYTMEYYLDGELIGSTTCINADESPIKNGTTTYVELIEEKDLPMDKVTDVSELELWIAVMNDKLQPELVGAITINADLGYEYVYALRGSSDALGYYLEQ